MVFQKLVKLVRPPAVFDVILFTSREVYLYNGDYNAHQKKKFDTAVHRARKEDKSIEL